MNKIHWIDTLSVLQLSLILSHLLLMMIHLKWKSHVVIHWKQVETMAMLYTAITSPAILVQNL